MSPESPWWLTRKGRFEDAEKAILRLTTGLSQDDAKKQVVSSKLYMASLLLTFEAMMHHTNEIEKNAEVGTRFVDCFKGVNFRYVPGLPGMN